jgi:hypothetical protein
MREENMSKRWSGWPYVLWGAGIGFVLGAAEALRVNWGSNAPSYERARSYYFQLGVFGPQMGGVIGYIIFKRRERCIQNRRAAGRCCGCGNDLTGNVSGTCPECGLRIPK